MAGHVFVVNSDLTKLRCDAWLCPVGNERNGSGTFIPVEQVQEVKPLWTSEDRVFLFRSAGANGDPAVWLADVVTFEVDDVLTAFVERAMAAQPNRRLRLALPLITTGFGGSSHDKGSAVREVLQALYRLTDEHDVDLVLVCFGDRPFGAVQRERSTLPGVVDGSAWALGSSKVDLLALADRLGWQARTGHLVGFVGAGVSSGAGLPLWGELLRRIAERVEGLDVQELQKLDLRDQAAILRKRLNTENEDVMASELSAALKAEHFSLSHALLASLPVGQWVTTNFDSLFEEALRTADRAMTVIPNDKATPTAGADQQRWLLKLHGSLDSDGGVVLSRSDYLQASTQWAALFGLVQGLLLTKHMLFVGYSLSDEDFHQLAHQVQTAKGESSPVFGTALSLYDAKMLAEVWAGRVELESIQSGSPSEAPDLSDLAERARLLDIFLDRLAFVACDSRSFLLDPTYERLLQDDERRLANTIRALRELALRSESLKADVTMQQFLRHYGA